MLTSDPAKWIVVGILACLHVTYWLWKRSKVPFSWKNLWPGIVVLVFPGACCCAPLLNSGDGSMAPMVAIACGLALSGRQASVNARAGVTFLGMVAALTFALATTIFTSMPEYTGSQIILNESHYGITAEGLPSLDRENKKRHFPAGYVSATDFGENNPVRHGPFHLVQPVPLWHTFLTGVYRRKLQPFRIWLPGGTAEQTLDGALGVPIGTPAGSEEKDGFLIDALSYDHDED